MSSRILITIILLLLTIFTGFAMMMAPGKDRSGKTLLKWTTDSCPQREQQVGSFNQLNPDCRLEIDPDNSGVMKVMVQSAAGMGPDLIDHVHEDSVQTYAEAGILWDVSKDAKKMGFGLDTLPESIRPLVKMTTVSKDGELIEGQRGYPCNIGYATLFFNKNLFDKYHVPYPSADLTWDEYIRLAQKMTVFAPGKNVIPDVFGGAGVQIKTIAMGRGGEYFNRWGTAATIDSEAFISAHQLYHNLMFKYNIEPSPNQKVGVSSQGGWGSGYITWFGEGKVAMFWGSRWILVQLRRSIIQQQKIRDQWLKDNPNANPADAPEVLRIGCVQIPRFADCSRVVPSYAKCTGINANSPKREKALKLLAYLAGEKYSMIINQGGDGLPGNQKYNRDIKLLLNPEYPGEEEVHRAELDAIPYGKTLRSSPFINNAVVNRIMKKVSDKLVASPGMSKEEIAIELRSANREINTIIARNIVREPKLFKLYRKLLDRGAEPVPIKLDKV